MEQSERKNVIRYKKFKNYTCEFYFFSKGFLGSAQLDNREENGWTRLNGLKWYWLCGKNKDWLLLQDGQVEKQEAAKINTRPKTSFNQFLTRFLHFL